MRGHTRKRGKTWSFIIDVGRDEDGHRRQKWHAGFRTKKLAEKAMAETLSELQKGTYVEPSRQTLGQYLRDWLDGTKGSLRKSTWSSYRMNVERHIIPALGSLLLQNVTPMSLNVFYAQLLEAGHRHGGGLSRQTVSYVAMILKRALSAAVRQNLLARNPADGADPPRPRSERKMSTWSPDELRSFLQSVRDDRLYAAWVLAATTGLRRGELLGLRWKDVDLQVGRIAISQTLLSIRSRIDFSTPKTAKGRRSVALDPTTVAALRTHRARQAEERLAWGRSYEDLGLVFTRENGQAIHPDRFSDWFESRVKSAGLPPIRLHDLRHTHATLALAAGIHPKVVSERLGHANISITLDTYSHSIPALEEEAAAKVARIVFGG